MSKIVAVSLMISVVLLAACGGKDEPRGAGGGPPAVVTTTVLAPMAWTDTIDALGTAAGRESVNITAKVSETVARVNFESGDTVKTGAVLVTLSDRATLAGRAAAEADFRESQQLFERQQDLAKRQLIAASVFDLQRAARDAAKARLDQVRSQVSDRVISAPFAGVLGPRLVSEGSLVTPGTVITTLDDVSKIHLDFSVPERQLAALAVGQVVMASSEAYPGELFRGVITSVGSRVDSVTRALAVRAEFDNPERKLRPGMLLQASVQRAGRQALQVPELSLVQLGRQAFVFRVGAENKVDQVPVKIGARRPGWVEIIDGVQAGDRIVVDGTVKLKPGSKIVEAKPEATNTPAAAKPAGA